jgi:hypothetical protein
MGVVVKYTTKDKKNLLGRKVVESGSRSKNGSNTSREVYNRKGELIKSKSISRQGGTMTKSKTNASGTTRTVSKPSDKKTMLEKRVSKAINSKKTM